MISLLFQLDLSHYSSVRLDDEVTVRPERKGSGHIRERQADFCGHVVVEPDPEEPSQVGTAA